VASISCFLEPDQAVAAAAGTEVEILDFRRLGGAWMLDRLWERLGIGAAIRRAAEGRQPDGEQMERMLYALVAQRALEPGSRLVATSTTARDPSMAACSPSRSGTARCSRRHSPAWVQATNRRCAVALDTPNSAGRCRQAQPVLST
jgi:hypothetical protein